MVEVIKALFGWFKPPNPTVLLDLAHSVDQKLVDRISEYVMNVRSWYFRVTTLSVCSIVFGIWALSPIGFARSDEVKTQVTTQIASNLKPISETLSKLSTSNQSLTQAVHSQLAISTSVQICRLFVRLRNEKSFEEKNRIRIELDSAQVTYRQYSTTGMDYPVSRCIE